MINNIDNTLVKLTNRKRTNINKITDENSNIITNTTEIQKIIKEYFLKAHTVINCKI
jgi:hypothetical protein